MKQYHIIVSGRVQGVGFRYFTQSKAVEHQISGWVRNKMDGTVEIVAEGEEQNLQNFLASIQKGSPFSNVENIQLTNMMKWKAFKSLIFVINH
ncbi:acylphosphatase [Aeribacillus composti]|nr:acylphosphatase [Aeribacillus composti]